MSAQSNKELIIRLNEFFALGNVNAFLEYCSEDVRWGMMGTTPLVGIESVREAMTAEEFSEPPIINVRNVIAEGDMVMAEGFMSMKKKDGSTFNADFCDIYKLKEGKIKELNSYVVEQAK
ncbi:nuclear transport factor 2 family protein [Solitalea lacus]|uniref:nuclear transport factor 2 family protein n=1 Tax=Solitalea lacus TaxID=2911172 RepID=UPI001EDC1E88|nr:nuclear transport factor 2 family protein [Solitalea lacus]UKJ07663.1 nuclear transport factor 2 family protein [Solitalea lacus]